MNVDPGYHESPLIALTSQSCLDRCLVVPGAATRSAERGESPLAFFDAGSDIGGGVQTARLLQQRRGFGRPPERLVQEPESAHGVCDIEECRLIIRAIERERLLVIRRSRGIEAAILKNVSHMPERVREPERVVERSDERYRCFIILKGGFDVAEVPFHLSHADERLGEQSTVVAVPAKFDRLGEVLSRLFGSMFLARSIAIC